MKIVHDKKSAPALAAPPVPVSNTIQQLMDRSKTPEAKIKAFERLFCMGTDKSIAKAVDYFFENPVLFSETVQKLAGETNHKEQLKKLLGKMTDSEDRISLFIHSKFDAASSDAKTIGEYQDALKPYFALKDAFEGIDRNRKSAHSCPTACDLLATFNSVNDSLNLLYGSKLFHQLGKLYVAQGPA